MSFNTLRFRVLFNRRLLTLDRVRGCQLWPSNQLDKDGYGVLKYKSGDNGDRNRRVIQVRAHRLSYILNVGPIPEGMEILHSCDNPRCVNPFHLSPGTRKQNEEDKVAKGRSTRGEQKSATLTDKEAQVILDRFRDGESIKYLAAEYDLPYRTCESICNRSRWKYLT